MLRCRSWLSMRVCEALLKPLPFLWFFHLKELLLFSSYHHYNSSQTNTKSLLASLLKFIYILGSTDPGSNIVHLKPFSTSILSFSNWIIATVPKICTKLNSILQNCKTFLFSSCSHLLVLFFDSCLFINFNHWFSNQHQRLIIGTI